MKEGHQGAPECFTQLSIRLLIWTQNMVSGTEPRVGTRLSEESAWASLSPFAPHATPAL